MLSLSVQTCRLSLTFVLCQPAQSLADLIVIKLTRQTSTIVIQCHLQKHCSSTPMIGSFFLIWATLSLLSPPEIAVTTQRPDIVIFSRSKKAVHLIELTVPLEDRVTAGHSRKENRYAALVQQCSENGWFARCFAVEVGCLGYVSPSLIHCLESLGIPSSTSRKLRNEYSRVAHRCSYVLFLRRKCTEWSSQSMG